jgi:hypothetical protein
MCRDVSAALFEGSFAVTLHSLLSAGSGHTAHARRRGGTAATLGTKKI